MAAETRCLGTEPPADTVTINPTFAEQGRRIAEEIRDNACPHCGWPLIDGCCTPECDAMQAEDEREERINNGPFGVGA